MLKKQQIILLFIGLFCTTLSGQNETIDSLSDTIHFKQIRSDTLFESNQIISLLSLRNGSNVYETKFDHSPTNLRPTSDFGRNNQAIAAINGSFYDMDKGGSVTYFEISDTVISKSKSVKNKWGKPNNLINGAIIIDVNNKITIEFAKAEQVYEASKKEAAVLVTGPMLLLNSALTEMPDSKFVKNRHPRTCLCTTSEDIILITIDGRQKNAAGMNLYEVQQFLKSINCINAVNLDGGGSTTMWMKGKGVVNSPSDKSGERSVSNVLLILKRD